MATLPTQVRAGDIISSELMNAILQQLAALGTPETGGGSQVVPNVFGMFLADARNVILQPARQLAMGFVFDTGGASVDPGAAANAHLIVLNQSPPADTRTQPNTPVNLVVSASSSGGGSTGNPAPTITRTETPSGTASTAFAVLAPMAIVGTNFSATASDNVVRFDGTVASSVANDPADPTRRLIVVVPSGIPGAPVNPGDPAKANVQLGVSTLGSAPVTTAITVNPPVANSPSITSVTPSTQFEKLNITIAGTNFTPTAQVLIRGVTATLVGTPTATSITATVPDFGDILPGPAGVPASVVVHIPSVGDATFGGTFKVKGA